MRSWALVCTLAALAACDDPSIQIQVEVPERYRAQVAQLALDVIVPPAGEPFDCDDIAFREVSEAQVRAATSQEVLVRTGEAATFSGIPRTGDKLFRVRGLGTDGEPVIAACEAYRDIDSEVILRLVGEPTTSAVLPPFESGAPLPSSLTVVAIDANSVPVPGIEVRFTVTGPGDDAPTSGSAAANDQGRAVLTPEAPVLPGPIALDVRPRWVQATPASLLAYTDPPLWLDVSLPGESVEPDLGASTEGRFAIGRIGPAGEVGVAALGPSDSPFATGRQVYLAYYDATQVPPFQTAVSAPIPGAYALGVVDTGPRDQLFTVTGSAWVEIASTGATTSSAAPKAGRVATRILAAGDCGGPPSSDEVLVVFSDESVGTYGPGGQAASSPFDDDETAGKEPLASACVVSTDDNDYRVVIFNENGFQQLAVAEMDQVRSTMVPMLSAGIGAAPRIGGAGPYLLGTEITIEGTELNRYRLLPLGPRALDLEVVTHDATTSIAASTIGGDFDADGEQDVAALVGFGDSARGTQFRVLTILEVDHLGSRLAGLSPSAQATRPRMWAADFDGDGVQEIVIGSPTGVSIVRTTGE